MSNRSLTAFVHRRNSTISSGGKPLMLIVLGVHRSGTSLTARMLECLGGSNSRNLLAAARDNPKGFFEDSDIVRFNQEVLLPCLGREWHDLEAVDWNLLAEHDRARLELRAEELLLANYSARNAISILKDPRLAILLPFWIPVLERAGYDLRVVGVIRDPVCVARSLAHRNGFSLTHGSMMYLVHWLGIISAVGKLPSVLLTFDDLLDSPETTVRRTAVRLGISLPEDFEERLQEFIGSRLDTSLRHYRAEVEDCPCQPQIVPLAKRLHGLLVSAAQNDQGLEQLRKFGATAADTIRMFGPVLAGYGRLQQEAEAGNAFKNRNATLEHLVHAMRAKISKLQHRIESMEGSRSWLLTRPLRLIDGHWRGQNAGSQRKGKA